MSKFASLVSEALTPERLAALPFRRRLAWLKRLVPAGMMLIVALYEFGPARWIHDRLGVAYHFMAEILIYGTVGPALAYLSLDLLGRWWEERETTELQAQILGQAQKHIQVDRQLDDDALQNLFAASVLLDSIRVDPRPFPPEVAAQLQAADQALKQAIRQLGPHLEQRSPLRD